MLECRKNKAKPNQTPAVVGIEEKNIAESVKLFKWVFLPFKFCILQQVRPLTTNAAACHMPQRGMMSF